MTSVELKVKADKAEENVVKTISTIERHKKQAEKKFSTLKENGWENLDRYEARDISLEAYWAVCEYEDKIEDIDNVTKKLEEKREILKNWKEKYKAQLQLEIMIENDIPEAFKEVKNNLVEAWNEFDLERKNNLKVAYKEMDYRDFIRKYRHSGYEFMKESNEQTFKNNERDAQNFIVDLWMRVVAITGKEITDTENITCTGYELNGRVYGTNGICEVTTILAGGYNIQRLHTRCLTKKVG